MWVPESLSCGQYHLQIGASPVQMSDRILFRKDWDHLALAAQAVRVVEP